MSATPVTLSSAIPRATTFAGADRWALLEGFRATPYLDFGAKADVIEITDAVMSSSSSPTHLSSASYTFTSADIFKLCWVKGAGASGAMLVAAITGISGSAAVLSTGASTSVTGAKCIFGTDDTAAINNAIDAISAVNKASGVLDLQNFTYMVDQCLLQSNIELRNGTLWMKPGNTRLKSPLTIDGRSSAKTTITLRFVTIDGKRDFQWGMATTPSAEDGGNHGVAMYGNCTDIRLFDVRAFSCATDGLCTPSYGVSTSDSSLAFSYRLVRCSFTWNRRHGWSGDSLEDVQFDYCDLIGNGLPQNGQLDLTKGDSAAPDGSGAPYGTGWWFEDNTSLAGGGVKRCILRGCRIIGNAFRSVYMLSHAGPFGGDAADLNAAGNSSTPNPGFLPRTIELQNCETDSGVYQYYGASYNTSTGVFTGGSYLNIGIQIQANDPAIANVIQSGIQALAVNTPGTGFVVGDVVTIPGSTSYQATALVTTIGTGGTVTGLRRLCTGNGFSIASGISVTGGHGSGLKVDIGAVGTNPCGAVFSGIIINGLKMLYGHLGVTQVDGFTLTGSMLFSGSHAATSDGTGLDYYLPVYINNYRNVTIPDSNNFLNGSPAMGFSALAGSIPLFSYSDVDGAFYAGAPQAASAVDKAFTVRPLTSQQLPNNVGVGSRITHQGNADFPGQPLMYTPGGWFSYAGGYDAGSVQLRPFCATDAYISAASWSAGVATFTTAAAHGLTSGQDISVRWIQQTAWNIVRGKVIAAPTMTSFTVALVSDPTGTPYVVPSVAGGNGRAFVNRPGGGSEGLVIYDQLRRSVSSLLGSGWVPCDSEEYDFANDADYAWSDIAVDMLFCAPITADRTVTLPPQSLAGADRKKKWIKNTVGSGHNITVVCDSSDSSPNIDGNASITLTPGMSVGLQPDTVAWDIVAVYVPSTGGALSVPAGGTGQTSFPSSALVMGNGTGAMGYVDPSSWPAPSGGVYPVLAWNSGGPTWGFVPMYDKSTVDSSNTAINSALSTLFSGLSSVNAAIATLNAGKANHGQSVSGSAFGSLSVS